MSISTNLLIRCIEFAEAGDFINAFDAAQRGGSLSSWNNNNILILSDEFEIKKGPGFFSKMRPIFVDIDKEPNSIIKYLILKHRDRGMAQM